MSPKPGRKPKPNVSTPPGKVIVKFGVIIVLSDASEQDWFEAAIASGVRDPPLPITVIESAIPSGLKEALSKKGVQVTMAKDVTIDGNGIPLVPESMQGISETYPGKPTDLPCQPVLNVFPDAAPTKWEDHQENVASGDSYPHWTLVCDRLKRAGRRYLEPGSECASTLGMVIVVWRNSNPPRGSVECWESFLGLLNRAKARGVQVRVRWISDH